MKKRWILLVSVLLVAALLVGCGANGEKEDVADTEKEETVEAEEASKPEKEAVAKEEIAEPQKETVEAGDTIVGKWVAEINLSEIMGDTSFFETIGINLDLDGIPAVQEIIELKADGTYAISIDAEAAASALKNSVSNAVDAFIEQSAKDAGMTVNEFLESEGVTKEDVAGMLGEVASMFDDMTGTVHEGNYTYENGELAMSDGLDSALEPIDDAEFKLAGDTITIASDGLTLEFHRVG